MSGGITATTIAAYASIAAAGIGVYSALQQGKQAEAQADYQAEQGQADADAAAGQAQVEAAQIRKAVQKQRSSARAALAESGVNADVGTGELIQSDIEQQGEQDALTTIYSGNVAKRKLSAQADGYTIAGQNAKTGSYLNAANSALGGATSYYGWKSKVATTKKGAA